MFTMRRGLLKALGRMVCRVLLEGFGVDVCSGCKGLLMVSGEDELLLNELNELDRSTGVVLNREEEKLGMPHWQHIQDVLSEVLYSQGHMWTNKLWLLVDLCEIFSREDIFANILFTRKYLPAKISSRENFFSRKFLPAKISSRELFSCRKYVG